MRRILALICLLSGAGVLSADTFKHGVSGETFNGFVTTKRAAGKTLVFNADQNKFIPVDLGEYQLRFGPEGRRESVMIISITKPEILLSETISKMAADSIQKAADAGPRLIVIQIDSPGGSGAYMQNITQTILNIRQQTGCPTAAYISGGQYGGAFSAAAVIALACDRIYIAPNATIGTVGPMAAAALTNQEYAGYLETFSPVTLGTFAAHAAQLAIAGNRPPALAKAFVDKTVTIVEVRDLTGRTSVVEASQRSNDQTVVHVISEGLSPAAMADPAASIQSYGKLLNLTAQEAIRLRLANKVAASYGEILSDMGLSDVQTVRVSGVEEAIQKFNAAKRNLSQLLSTISENENRISVLQEQIAKVEDLARTGTLIRERNPLNDNTRYYRSGRNRYDNRTDPRPNRENYILDRSGRRIPTNQFSTYSPETVVTEEPVGNIQQIQLELVQTLNNTIPLYRRAVNLAKRWPGALPAGVSIQTLQTNMDTAQVLLTTTQRNMERFQY